jgi:effector-binding domain-containing protein
MSDVTEIQMEPMMVLGMRKKGHYKEIANMLPAVFEYAVHKGADLLGPAIFVCHESSKEEMMKADAEGTADIEVAVPVGAEVEGTEDIAYYELPGGKMAKTVHKGPYEECDVAYDRLLAWLEENGKRITGPMREHYLNDPREVPPDEILTEIFAPIE